MLPQLLMSLMLPQLLMSLMVVSSASLSPPDQQQVVGCISALRWST